MTKRNNLARWPGRFRDSLEWLCISISFRAIFGFLLLYSVAWRAFLCCFALVEWFFSLLFFTYYAYTKPKKWRYSYWIIFTSTILIASTVFLIMFGWQTVCYLQTADRQMMELDGLPWYPSGTFPSQWSLPGALCTWYFIWIAFEFLVLRVWTLICAFYSLKKRHRHLKYKKIGDSLLTAFYSVDEDDAEKRKYNLLFLKYCLQLSWILFWLGTVFCIASFVNLKARPRCGVTSPCYALCEPSLGSQERNRLCMVPFPSSHFLVSSKKTKTGYLLHIDGNAAPLLRTGNRFNVSFVNFLQKDGFSPMTPIAFTFWDWFDDFELPKNDDNVVVVNAATGEKHPIWVQKDERCNEKHSDDENCLIFAHPMVRFDAATEYVVGVQHFNTSFRQEKILPHVAQVLRNHVSLDDIQLAWSFVVESEGNSVEYLKAIEKKLDDSEKETTFEIVAEKEEKCVDEHKGKIVHGFAHIPKLLDTKDDFSVGFVRAEKNETTKVRFSMYISCEALIYESNETHPTHFVQYGHTVLGRTDDFAVDPVHNFVKQKKWILFCTEWRTINIFQFYMTVRSMMISVDAMMAMTDSVALSIVEKHFVYKKFVESPVFRSIVGNQKLVRGSYWGHSFGAIVGSSYACFSDTVQKAALISGGVPALSAIYDSESYSSSFAWAMRMNFFAQEDVATVFALMATVATNNDASPFYDCTAKKQFLVHNVVNDPTISIRTGQDMARLLQCQQTVPFDKEIFGLSDTKQHSFYTQFEYGTSENAVFWPEKGIAYHTALRFNQNSTNAIARMIETETDAQSPCVFLDNVKECTKQHISYDI